MFLVSFLHTQWEQSIQRILSCVDGTTMYRVVLYALSGMIVWAAGAALLGYTFFAFADLMIHSAVVLVVSMLAHVAFQKLSGAPANVESTFITAFILIIILTPTSSAAGITVSALAALIAIASKYVFVYGNRHIFNPAALALFIVGVIGYSNAEWWVGSTFMLPAVLIGGLVLALKTRRYELQALYILLTSVITLVVAWDLAWASTLMQHFLSWPTIFFATVMLVEPLGMPGSRREQLIFTALVAVLGTVPFALPPVYGTPELALLVGNIYAFIVAFPRRHTLTLVRSAQVGGGVVEYFFAPHAVKYAPGQYMEWVVPHAHPDIRGTRRFISISSPVGAEEISFAVRHVEKGSSFKKELAALKEGATVYAVAVAGDFTLQEGPSVFIAGGIGITPFMSMLRTAAARHEQLNATLFYCNSSLQTIAFKDEIDALCRACSVRVVHVLAQPDAQFASEAGYFTSAHISKYVTEPGTATYYISGPPVMVTSAERAVRSAAGKGARTVTDFFPGLA